MAKNSIRLSEKHGVNPTIPVCFWCGKKKNEIALLGRLPHDAEAPMNMVLNYDPCEECLSQWDKGVTLIEASETPNGENQPPIAEGVYPTGNFMTLTEHGIEVLFNEPMAKQLKQMRKGFIDREGFNNLKSFIETPQSGVSL